MQVPDNWPTEKYSVILADPPWRFRVWSKKGNGLDRSPEKHYPTMSFAEIKALPVVELAEDDCVLFLWITMPMLQKAFEVVDSWNGELKGKKRFIYKTVAFTWAKTNKTAPSNFFMGLGYWTRANAELCLLFTRGNPHRVAKDVRQLIVSQRREHSRKPDCVHERIERLVVGPYVELFARTQVEGWDCWGAETDKFPAELTLDI
ncbi:adenine methyltransferase [Patescibacteria group bacterium]|nr:adenine methyltransferase [Patescibacteria group bacterium]